MYVKSIVIERVMPCIADPMKIRVIARADRELKEVLPYLDKVIPSAYYSNTMNVLTFKRGSSLITIYGDGKITMTKITDEDEARMILDELKELINKTWERRDSIDISKPKARVKLGPIEVFTYLPKVNCGMCGEQSCMAFAVKLLKMEKKLDECPLLKEEKYRGLRETLESLLIAAGYIVSKNSTVTR